jgi:hypothetical protein
MTLNRTSRNASILLVTALAVAGCASNGSKSVSSQSIAAPPARLLTSTDIKKGPAGSPERAFLRHWSYLQYLSWSAAVSDYEPALARSIGVTRLVEALKTQATYFPTAKPLFRGTVRVGDEFVVRYSIPDGSGHLTPTSVSWRRVNGEWKIHYDTQLDGMLQTAAQLRVQNEIDPNASRPSKKAIQAGVEAARLQSQYLQATYRRR